MIKIVPKLPNKALLSCLTLVTTYSTAALEQANAAEITIKNNGLDQKDTLDSADSKTSKVSEETPETIQQQQITPDSTLQPTFTSQHTGNQRAEERLALATPQNDNAATLEHLVATASREIPSTSQLLTETSSTERQGNIPRVEANNAANLEHLVATASREIPSTSQLLVETSPIDGQGNLSRVEANGLETNISEAISRESAIAALAIESVIEPVKNSRVADATQTAATEPAVPAVAQPRGHRAIIELAQVPVQDSSGAIGDSFRPEDLTEEELRQILSVDNPVLPTTPPSPASSFGTPTAYGANGGDAFIGLAGVTGGNADTDGSMSLGVGFGDAVDAVGVEVNLGIISLDGFADDGQIGIKVHKIFPEAGNLGVAVGWSNAITWGAANDAEETFYGVVTKRFDLQPDQDHTMPLTLSAGVGTGSFRSLGAIDDNNNDPNIFGSVGLQVSPRLSVVSSWTGSALNAGLSVAPFDFPLVLTAGASDITSNTDAGTRFSASIGYGFKF